MGVYSRPDSPVWWLWLKTIRRKERTDIEIGTTAAQRRDSRKIAEDRYHQRMNEIAARLYKLPTATPAIRFAKYAESYRADTIALRKGARREGELLDALLKDFGDELLTAIDADRVRLYMRRRRETRIRINGKDSGRTVSAVTVNREVDLLKAMLRDAVPKYLNESPIVGLRRLPIVKPKRRLMTADEEQRLLGVCKDAQDRAILVLGIDTLMRLGELLKIRRTDRDGFWLFVGDTKNGEPVDVALSPRAAEALDAIADNGPFYFSKFRRAENPRDWPGSVRQRLEFLCRQAHIDYGRAKGGLTFHWATRRTGATRLLIEKGAAVPVVQRQGNWKKADVLLSIYAEAQREDLLRAVGHPFPKRSRQAKKRA
jgi:integrase